MTTASAEQKTQPRLLQRFREEVAGQLREQFGCKNPMEIPTLRKIVISMGLGSATENKARIDHAVRELSVIAGQRPTIRNARKAIAGFKIRAGYPVGVAVTLRGARMWEFADRLLTIAIPRIRDFRGLPRKLDGNGNYSIGISEQTIFPEVNIDKIEYVQGMNITFVTSAKTDEHGIALLEKLGVPFRK